MLNKFKLHSVLKALYYPNVVQCVWGEWSMFSQCDKSCGGGKMYKTRTKLEPAKYGGTCPGVAKVIKDCNTHKCPSKCLFK